MKCANNSCKKQAAPCCDYCLSHQAELDQLQAEQEYSDLCERTEQQLEAYHSFVGPYPLQAWAKD